MENKKSELAEVIKSSGLEVQTGNYIKEKFLPFFEQAEQWKSKAESLVVTDEAQVDEMKLARQARLALKEIRVEADKTRKALKEDSLRYGKAVQGVYNLIEFLITPIEQHLQRQEDFPKIQEAKRKKALKEEREAEIQPYYEFVPFGIDLSELSESDYIKTLNGAKLQLEAKKEAERKAEEERIRKTKEEAEERERIRIENEKLKAEAEERERLIAEEKAKAEAERKKIEAKLKAEAEERERLQREIKEKEYKELAEKKAKELAEKKAKAAPDKTKLLLLATQLSEFQLPSLKSEEANQILDDVKSLLDKISAFILKKVNEI